MVFDWLCSSALEHPGQAITTILILRQDDEVNEVPSQAQGSGRIAEIAILTLSK